MVSLRYRPLPPAAGDPEAAGAVEPGAPEGARPRRKDPAPLDPDALGAPAGVARVGDVAGCGAEADAPAGSVVAVGSGVPVRIGRPVAPAAVPALLVTVADGGSVS